VRHLTYLLLYICVSHPAFAGELPTYYPRNDQVLALDPVTGKQSKLPTYGAIKNAFLLNANGTGPFKPDGDSLPFVDGLGNPYIGIMDASGKKILAVPADELTTVATASTVIRTPTPSSKNEAGLATDCTNCHKDQHLNLDATIPYMDMLKKFHNEFCEKGRKDAMHTTTAAERDALFREWDKFVAGQPAKLKAKAEMARAIDLAARTVAYESLDVGKRDNKPALACKDETQCPAAACEMRVVALVIKNQATNGKAKTTKPKPSRIRASATNESEFDIWKGTYTSPLITTCLLKDGLESGDYEEPLTPEERKVFQENALKFKMAIAQTARVMAEDASRIFENSRGKTEKLYQLRNYFHPPAMGGCERSTYSRNQITNDAIYAYRIENDKIVDVKLLIRDWVLPEPGTGLVKFKKRIKTTPEDLALNPENRSHKWAPLAEGDWYINSSDAHDVVTTNKCEPMGLPYYRGVKKSGCETPEYTFSAKTPCWAYTRSENKPHVVCKGLGGEGEKIGYGGPCDRDMQLIVSGKGCGK
jgi:hypothetical protein